MKFTKSAFFALCVVGLFGCSEMKTSTTTYMEQDILSASGGVIGKLTLRDLGENGTEVKVALNGLDGAGSHAMHFHEKGLCDAPEFKSSGGHYNPTGMAHGKMAENGPHAGDMMNIEVDAQGSGSLTVINNRVSIKGDNNLPALLDADGTALIIHAKADDYITQPTGAAGARIGCAVLK